MAGRNKTTLKKSVKHKHPPVKKKSSQSTKKGSRGKAGHRSEGIRL